MDLVEWGNRIKDFSENIKIILTGFWDWLPSELSGILITVIVIVVGLFIYRFLKG